MKGFVWSEFTVAQKRSCGHRSVNCQENTRKYVERFYCQLNSYGNVYFRSEHNLRVTHSNQFWMKERPADKICWSKHQCVGFVVKNGWKSFCWISLLIRGPESLIRTTTRPSLSCNSKVTHFSESTFIASTALLIKLTNTCSISISSQNTWHSDLQSTSTLAECRRAFASVRTSDSFTISRKKWTL